MKDILSKTLQVWKNKNGENSSIYPEDKIVEIATNCVSLSETWFDRTKDKKVSFELNLYNKDGDLSETLHGVGRNNLPYTMLDIAVNNNDKYSKLELCTFRFKDGEKEEHSIGEMLIS